MKQIIWVVREGRCGSTWFVNRLVKHLNKENYMFESFPEFLKLNRNSRHEYFKNRKQDELDYNRILHSHDFSALKYLENYKSPMVFRCARKDKTEQFLSLYYTKLTHTFNLFDNTDQFHQVKNVIVFPKESIDQFVQYCKLQDKFWNQIPNYIENETIYYEDLLEGYRSRLLPEVDLDMRFIDTYEKNTLKLPYNKKEIFLNYNQIRQYVEYRFSLD